ncbi:hypothetical protein [Acidaminobacterium chupaoyuni]
MKKQTREERKECCGEAKPITQGEKVIERETNITRRDWLKKGKID